MTTILNVLHKARDINILTGSPLETYDSNGKANIGNYHLDWAYSGVSLHRVVTENGGIRTVINGYHSKPEMYRLLCAFIAGIESK